MRKKSVAVLDIRSYEITAVVGERGVNDTFIIKSKYSCGYDGFAEGNLLSEESFLKAVDEVVSSTVSSTAGLKSFYVGIPAEFLKLINTDKVISFQSAKKIGRSDCDSLAGMSAPSDTAEYQTIRHGCLYFVLSDKRKTLNPIGTVSDSLHGKFCFYQCKTAFVNILLKAFKKFTGIAEINLLPTVQAEAMYLISPEKRNDYAVLFDLGYISSAYSVVCGNGLAFCESFSIGIGHIAMHLMNELEIPFDVASALLSVVNLNARESLGGYTEYIHKGETYKFSTSLLRDKIREGLDGICEAIEACSQSFSGRNIDGKPIKITGEGVKVIRGTAEHISNRMVKNVDIVAPIVPYYDKPQYSSMLSLLDAAINDAESSSFFNK